MKTSTVIRLPHNAIMVEDKMPYQALVNRLRDRLNKESNKDRREEIELEIIMLIGIMDLKRTLDKMILELRNVSK